MSKLNKKYNLVVLLLVILIALEISILAVSYLKTHDITLLSPAGPIAQKERDLMVIAGWLMLLVVIPVFGLTAYVAWHYRAGNTKAKYNPDWDHNRIIEGIWWLIPTILILILSVIAWDSSHQLDPFKPIASDVKPLHVQVIAMQWKWLFIYPEQNVASVNYLRLPVNTPVNFEITSDGPMNSFWIPKLGGQIYAMSGMSTQLHLEASKPGTYFGRSANISGQGFAGMNFTVEASSADEFNNWVISLKSDSPVLGSESFIQLAKPSENNKITYYHLAQSDLYNKEIAKFSLSGHGGEH